MGRSFGTSVIWGILVKYAWTLPATRDTYIKELEKAIILVQNSKK
jgi:hypothetical protein